MRITFQSGGGVAPMPGLGAAVTIDVQALPPDDQAAIREMVERSAFFALPPRITTARTGAADLRTYTITIDDEGRLHTVVVTDPIPAGDLRTLVDRLRWHAAVARRAGKL
jgi:hypothetical protein